MSGLEWTTCPHCGAPLVVRGRTLGCDRGHSFDIARQGYVNLLGHAAPANADTPAMLAARARFLDAGHYLPIAEAAAGALGGARRVLEVGAGTGWYLARLLDAAASAEGLATDVSTAAAKRAARAHPRACAVVADTWAGLPVRSGAVDLVACIFAPRNPAEFARVLAPGGRAVIAMPMPAHLAELRQRYGLLGIAADKHDALLAAFGGWRVEAREQVTGSMQLSSAAVSDLIAMGPNAFHGLPDEVSSAEVTLAVEVVTLAPPAA